MRIQILGQKQHYKEKPMAYHSKGKKKKKPMKKGKGKKRYQRYKDMEELLNYAYTTYGEHQDYNHLFDAVTGGDIASNSEIDQWIKDKDNG